MSGPVLVVDDDPLQLEMLERFLRRKMDYGCHKALNGREALSVLEKDKQKSIRLVIMDIAMPVMGGMEALEIMRQKYPDVGVVMLTGTKDVDHAVRAIKLGATDFLTKPYDIERLMVTVKNAFKIGVLAHEISRLKHKQENKSKFENLIGYEQGLAEAVVLGRKAAATDIPVLITGETGVGKDVFAQAVHGESLRSGRPFIAVNCGAIPAQLAESTLFGHEKGAFTGATEKTLGKFREAEGGTIFLDEVGELPLDVQVKLLRVLQQKEVEPVGSAKTVPVNVRIISATHRSLEADIKAGRFREDLFFRLNVMHIFIPPLRDRRQDIPALARGFMARFCAEHGKTFRDISDAALKKLCAAEWPGNIRQLENVLSRAMVVGEGDLDENDLHFSPYSEAQKISSQPMPADFSLYNEAGHFKTMEEIEVEAMRCALEQFDGNTTQAAKALGIAKSTFYRKIRATKI